MNKTVKRLLIGIPAAAAVCALIFFWQGRNRKKDSPDAGNEEYRYDIVDNTQNYSEHSVLYLDDSKRLHMIDTASGKDMIYCDKPNCTHEGYSRKNLNPSCPAAFQGLNCCGTVLHNRHLYFIGNMADEDLRTKYLYVMDANGENRRKTAKLEGVERIPYVLYREHYVVGSYDNVCELTEDGQVISNDKYETGIFVIDLDDYSVQMGNKITDGQPVITGIHYENGSVYYLAVHYGEGITDQMVSEAFTGDFEAFYNEHLEYDLYRYDIAEKETVLVKTLKHVKSPQMAESDVYYFTEDGLFAYDGKSGETKQIPIANASGQMQKAKDAAYIGAYSDDRSERIYYRVKNGQIEELMRRPSDDSFIIAAICGESVYIDYTENGQYWLCVLSMDDLNHNRFNPRKLRNYDEE